MTKLIDIIVYEPGEAPVVKQIATTLEAAQAVVGGLIEYVRADQVLPVGSAGGRLSFICNEEGRLHNLPANRWGLVGTFFATRTNKDGDPVTLTERDKILLLQFTAGALDTASGLT